MTTHARLPDCPHSVSARGVPPTRQKDPDLARLSRIIELEVVVYELQNRLDCSASSLRSGSISATPVGSTSCISIGHRHDIEGGSCEHLGRHQAVTVWHNVDRQFDES